MGWVGAVTILSRIRLTPFEQLVYGTLVLVLLIAAAPYFL
jgi:hypothetical protein